MNMIYGIEIIVAFLVLILEIFLIIKKKISKSIMCILITLALIIVAFVVTFIMEKPQIDLAKFETIEVKSKISNPNTIYHFKNITDKVKIVGDIDVNKVGEYEVKVEVPTNAGTYSKTCKVKVVDTKAPTLELEGDLDCTITDPKQIDELGYKAIDEYEGDLTEKVEKTKKDISESEYNLIYTVSDSSGNKAQKERHIKWVDGVPPTINLNGNYNVYLTLNSEYEEQGATAEDDKDGDVSDTLSIEGTVDTSKEGLNIITYKAKDKTGNEAVVNRNVLVSREGKVYPQDGTKGKKGVIYLTFDDGPSATTTPKILDVLDKKGVKATFFIINYDEAREKLVKREHEAGHTVAIHGYSHTYSEIYKSDEAYMNNITKLREKIKESIGVDSTITRFPGGSSNTISRHYSQGIMTRMAYKMVENGYTYFDWNVDSDDAGSAKTSDDVYRNVTTRLSKDKANVVLMHDFSGNDKTLNALESIIDFGLKNGYTFEVLTPETQMVTHSTNN